MKVALINGSPKFKDSASESLIYSFMRAEYSEIECKVIGFNRQSAADDLVSELSNCDSWVFFFPVYVDGVPGHLLSCLEQLASNRDISKGKFVCAVTNCGFSDGEQGEYCMNIIRNWAVRSGNVWGGGIGIGEGGALPELLKHKSFKYPAKLIGKSFERLANNIRSSTRFENEYTNGGLPMLFYKIAVERYWAKRLRENGKNPKDISYAP